MTLSQYFRLARISLPGLDREVELFFLMNYTPAQEGLFIKNALYLDKHQPALPALFRWILSKFPHLFSFPFKLKRTEQRHVFVFPG